MNPFHVYIMCNVMDIYNKQKMIYKYCEMYNNPMCTICPTKADLTGFLNSFFMIGTNSRYNKGIQYVHKSVGYIHCNVQCAVEHNIHNPLLVI